MAAFGDPAGAMLGSGNPRRARSDLKLRAGSGREPPDRTFVAERPFSAVALYKKQTLNRDRHEAFCLLNHLIRAQEYQTRHH
jgi:hypothetical protein